jgi:hypothetical protein
MFSVKNEEKVDCGQMSAYRLLALERLDLKYCNFPRHFRILGSRVRFMFHRGAEF